MINKKQLIIFLIALVIIAIFTFIGFKKSEVPIKETPMVNVDQELSLETEKLSISEKTEYLNITANYPKVKSESISKYFENYVKDQIVSFKEDTSWAGDFESPAELSLDIDYKNIKSTLVQNYIFSSYSYTGGAHGMQVRRTFSFNREGKLLNLADLFIDKEKGLVEFSKLVQKELLKRENADADWIADGAGPKEENYQSFTITDEGLTVLFDQYQVAPYSDGQIDITIPLESLKSFVNKDLFNL